MRASALFFLFYCLSSANSQTTILVSHPWGLQPAINLAVSGDTILVAPGEYYGPFDTLGKALVLASTQGPSTTRLNGRNLGVPTLRIASGEGPGTVVDGFTIYNGFAANGGALQISTSSPTVRNCVIRSSRAADAATLMTPFSMIIDGDPNKAGRGGGVSISSGSPVFVDCEIKWNEAGRGFYEGGAGGGVWIAGSASTTWTRCRFLSNTGGAANRAGPNGQAIIGRGGSGGAVAVNGTGTNVFVDCEFLGNAGGAGFDGPYIPFSGIQKTHGGHGGAVSIEGGAAVTFQNSRFISNRGGDAGRHSMGGWIVDGGSGGALYAVGYAMLSISSCHFENNTGGRGGEARDWRGGSGGDGGAVYLQGNPAIIIDSTFEGNSGGEGGAGLVVLPNGAHAGVSGGHGGSGGIHSLARLTLIRCSVTGSTGGRGAHSGDSDYEQPNGGNGGPAGVIINATGASTVIGCLIAQNHGGDGGDGKRLDELPGGPGGRGGNAGLTLISGSCLAASNTIADNLGGTGGQSPVTPGAPGRGGILAQSCQVQVADSIVWHNSSGSLISLNSGGVFSTNHSAIEGGASGLNNTPLNPLFVSRNTCDYRLGCLSPGVDSGEGLTLGLPSTDLNGSLRIQNGVIDMGAFEGGIGISDYSGNSIDLDLNLSVQHGTSSVLAAPCVFVHAGDTVELELTSPTGAFAGTYPLIIAQVFPTSFAPPSLLLYPELHLNPEAGFIFVLVGTPNSLLGVLPLPTSGLSFTTIWLPGLETQNIRFQSLLLSPLAPNSIFYSSPARELVVLATP